LGDQTYPIQAFCLPPFSISFSFYRLLAWIQTCLLHKKAPSSNSMHNKYKIFNLIHGFPEVVIGNIKNPKIFTFLLKFSLADRHRNLATRAKRCSIQNLNCQSHRRFLVNANIIETLLHPQLYVTGRTIRKTVTLRYVTRASPFFLPVSLST